MPAEQSADLEAGVLMFLIDEQHTQLTLTEVIKGMFADPEVFNDREPIERAVRDLVAIGLVHRHGKFVFATRTAVYFNDLPT